MVDRKQLCPIRDGRLKHQWRDGRRTGTRRLGSSTTVGRCALQSFVVGSKFFFRSGTEKSVSEYWKGGTKKGHVLPLEFPKSDWALFIQQGRSLTFSRNNKL
jgi:hypothetical protein